MSTAMASPITGKNVFAHFMMGNTYPYRPANFRTDIEDAIEAGIDGFALNLGQDSWAPARVETMFSVASEFPQYKLFFSFDMSIITSASVIVDYVLRYVKHRNSFWYDNRYFMSTFAGESQSFGHGDVNEGWDVEVRQKLKDKGVEICFVPSWTGMDAWKMFERFPVVDGAFSWAAWPFPDVDTPAKYDEAYMRTAKTYNKLYMAGVSPCFFTHFPWKNWVYPDSTLLIRRFQELVQSGPELIEIISWNDWGESHYVGTLQKEAGIPEGAEKWITGFDHKPWLNICKYFIQAYKTRSYPAITEDLVIFWYPPHLNSHSIPLPKDPLPCPEHANMFKPTLAAAVFLKDRDNEIVLKSGSEKQIFRVSNGFHAVEMSLYAGRQAVEVRRNGRMIIIGQGQIEVTSKPSDRWNFNLFVQETSGV